jgi:hypothetical protein
MKQTRARPSTRTLNQPKGTLVSADIETAETGELDTPNMLGTFQRRSFTEMITQPLDATEGRALVDKERLEGVEHIITGCVYRDGAAANGYVSVEATTATDNDIVYNDSSTVGIADQLAAYLTYKGVVKGWTPENHAPWDRWEIVDTRRAVLHVAKNGTTSLHVKGLALHVRGGLRASKDYDVEITGDDGKKRTVKATTYYLG